MSFFLSFFYIYKSVHWGLQFKTLWIVFFFKSIWKQMGAAKRTGSTGQQTVALRSRLRKWNAASAPSCSVPIQSGNNLDCTWNIKQLLLEGLLCESDTVYPLYHQPAQGWTTGGCLLSRKLIRKQRWFFILWALCCQSVEMGSTCAASKVMVRG